ncbi:MAG: hypothetical protein ABSA27_13465, partial [Terriglobales bacterium]
KRRCPTLPLWGMRALFSASPGDAEVEVVSGACLMVKRDIFEKVGRFSTEYFMYAEEMDLCRKIRHAGWKVCHVRDAQVVHFGGQSTKQKGDAFADIVMHESVFKLLRKFRGNAYAQLYRAALLVSAVVRLIVLGPLLVIPVDRPCHDALHRAFRKWRNIAGWGIALAWSPSFAEDNPTTAVKS